MIECDISKPYLFISYSHKNTSKGYEIINELIKSGYRIWYDDGIHLGEEWPETVATFLKNAFCILFIIDQGFIQSKNCRREVNYAVDLDKKMFAIFIEQCNLSPGLKMQLGTIQSFQLSSNNVGLLIDRILSNSLFQNPKLLMDNNEIMRQQTILISQNSLVYSQTIAIGILKHKGSVLMLKRKNPEGNLVWGFPTSIVKPNEEPKLRIIKEFYAETGIHTTVLKQIGSRVHPDTKAICFYYALVFIDGVLENKDEYENAEAKWINTNLYKSLISTNLYKPVMEYISEKPIEVVMCIVVYEGKILLVHRADKDPNLSWAFPGGTVESGENVFQTAIRELKEETNINSEIIEFIGDRIHPYSKKHIAYVALKPTSFDIIVGDDDLDLCQWFDTEKIDLLFGSPVYEKVKTFILQNRR